MLFEFKKKDIIQARRCSNDGDWVEISEGIKLKRKKIRETEWYVVEGNIKKIVTDAYFKSHYEPINTEARLHLENPTRRIGGVL